MVLIFIGAAGSGKDTQAEILADKYGFRVISTGQIFRDAMEQRTEEGLEAEKFTSEGDLVPDELVYRMLGRHLNGTEVSKLIFTGAVRSPAQVSLMDDTLAKLNTAVDRVVYFKLTDEEAIKRISGRRYAPNGNMYHIEYNPPKVEGIDDETGEPLEQREDDQPEAMAERLSDFHANNGAILDAYRQRNILIEIDASKSIQEVAADLEQKLNLNK